MTVEEFFKAVEGAKGVSQDILHTPVEVRLKSRDGLTMSDHFKLTHAGYMFSPFLVRDDGTRGSFVLEFRVQ